MRLAIICTLAICQLCAVAEVYANDGTSVSKAVAKKGKKKSSLKRKQRSGPPPESETSLPSAWSELPLAGSIRAGYFALDRKFENKKDLGSAGAWLNFRPEPIWGVDLFIDAYAQATTAAALSDNRDYDVREVYLAASAGDFDLRIGRQIIVWGRADKINPTDFLSVRNGTLLVINDEDQRTGQGAVLLTGNFGDSRLIFVLQPEWRRPSYAIPPLPSGIVVEEIDSTGGLPYAIKFDRMSDGFDFSVSFFSGYDRIPDVEVFAAPSALGLGLKYNQIQGYGLDFAFNVGQLGCRGEFAYVSTGDFGGTDPLVKNSHYTGVIGADRSFGESVNVNIQYLFKATERWREPAEIAEPTLASLGGLVNLFSNQQQEHQQGAVARIAWKTLADSLTIEAAYLSWFNRGDSLIRPKISYLVRDGLHLIVGADIYGGARDTYLGRYTDLSAAYSELRWSF